MPYFILSPLSIILLLGVYFLPTRQNMADIFATMITLYTKLAQLYTPRPGMLYEVYA